MNIKPGNAETIISRMPLLKIQREKDLHAPRVKSDKPAHAAPIKDLKISGKAKEFREGLSTPENMPLPGCGYEN